MPGKGDGIDIALLGAAWDQGAAIPCTERGFQSEVAERIAPDCSGILVTSINEDTITKRPCGGWAGQIGRVLRTNPRQAASRSLNHVAQSHQRSGRDDHPQAKARPTSSRSNVPIG